MTNPKCPNCTKWYNCAKCEAGYEDQLCTCPDNPEFDGTDGAHPAWWRGYNRAKEEIARLQNQSKQDQGS